MEKKYALINCTLASLRKEPEKTSEQVDEEFYGRKVEILNEPIPGWYYVRTQYNYTGYIYCSDLLLNGEYIRAWDAAEKKVIHHSYADILTLPKYQGHCLISITRGAVIAQVQKADENGWTKVVLCDGTPGFIKEKFLGPYRTDYDLADEINLRNALANTALSYMGTQYRWGGKSPLGIDCSGLCSVAYRLNGILIYRDSSIKEEFPIKEIAPSEIKRGDLLYFPGHIAMYLGNGQYIHATGKNGSDGVVINSFNPGEGDYREDLHRSLKTIGSLF